MIVLYRLIIKMVWFVVLFIVCLWVIKLFDKPWPLIEGQPLVHQMGACQLINLGTGAENYIQALELLGISAPIELAVELAINGPPSFGRRYDCFANLTNLEADEVLNSPEYQMYMVEIYSFTGRLTATERGK